MHLARFLARFGYRQIENLAKVALGKPLTTPSLVSTTLDEDDVWLARAWLKRIGDWYRSGEIEQYHAAFAAWNGSTYAFSFMGGRVALSAAIHALGLEPGDEVVLPGYTCVVVPNAFHYAGVKTVYSDIELETYGLDVSQVETKITPRTKAIFLHHLYGLVCRDYEAIISIARRHNLYVIEDCAQSTGAEYKGKKVGNWGDVAIYSSEHSKVFNTVQGGIVVANDDVLARKIQEFYDQAAFPEEAWIDKQLFNLILDYYRFKHPQRWWRGDWVRHHYRDKILISTTKQEEQGVRPAHYGRKMPAAIAAIGLNQLKKIDYYNELRRQTARRWDRWCEASGYRKPLVVDQSVPVYLRYPVLVEPEKKQDLSWALRELGVWPGVWFVSNIHPAHWTVTGCPNADQAVKRCINLPGMVI
ncbi:MAG: aminotransferase class I/II-fold pyridoxal phosphate-dependent enzyme [Chloroflexota bacterium]|nr:aminotransferase class I/II-fold pyridoxal phosphate-dependent enzyme [Chloroflexota bacterium]